MMISNLKKVFLLCIFLCCCINAFAESAPSMDEFERLKLAYPENIQSITKNYIVWKDGSRMLIRGFFPFIDKWRATKHNIDLSIGSISRKDIIYDSYEPFFRKMYGNTASAVRQKLVTIYWMPKVFGKRYPLKVTTVNGVDKKLLRISAELEKLPRSYYKYVEKPASSFYWRNVARESYLSMHSFGIAIDINVDYSNYWMWDLDRAKKSGSTFKYQNHIPMKIVEIFEKEGFSWGGRWYHYDTMHFEYRPEVFI